MKKVELKFIPATQLVTLKRNPQYLTPEQMESLKASIARDGFCVPILVRPHKRGRYEIVSGNHRYMAARELDLKLIPCVVSQMDEKTFQRLAINLNTIHGEPNAELLAPFLAELDLSVLKEIHIEAPMKKELMDFDAKLAEALKELELPDHLSRESPTHKNATCKCPKCGTTHIQKSAD